MLVDFAKVNVNPKNRKTTDCVIRALTVAIHDENRDIKKEYYEVLNELVNISIKTGYMYDDKHVFEKFLENHGFVKYKQPRKRDNTKYQIGEIESTLINDIVMYDGDKDTCVISCAHHLTVYTNVIIDTWDCRRKTIGNYWIKRK